MIEISKRVLGICSGVHNMEYVVQSLAFCERDLCGASVCLCLC